MKLYELSKMLTDLEAELDNTLDATSDQKVEEDEIRNRLDQFGVQFEFKAEQIAKMIQNYKSDIVQLKQEEDRLQDKRQKLAKRNERLAAYLLGCMNELDIQRIKGDILTIAIRENPYSVGEVDLLGLPEEYTRFVPERREPDRTKILKHFNETGEIVNGVSEISRTKRLEIK
jgi:hypothetical protein